MERRALLGDLVSRLKALIRHLRTAGVAPSAFSALTQLVAAIEAGGTHADLWETTLRVLDTFAGGAGSSRRTRAFWKRS